MKKLLITVTMCFAVSAFANDISVTVPPTSNLRISISANGSLDSTPSWKVEGNGTIQVDIGGMTALLVTSGFGTNFVTVTATANGVQLISRVTAIVKPPPATILAVSANPVAK